MNVKEIKRKPLTSAQREYYDFICEFIAAHGSFPTIREIKEGTGKAYGSVLAGLLYLHQKGYIEQAQCRSDISRNWRLAAHSYAPDLRGAHVLAVKEPQTINYNTVPSGSFVVKRDNEMIGCWIPAHCIGGHHGKD
jgi:SOS-response transcriptional repressor LexA